MYSTSSLSGQSSPTIFENNQLYYGNNQDVSLLFGYGITYSDIVSGGSTLSKCEISSYEAGNTVLLFIAWVDSSTVSVAPVLFTIASGQTTVTPSDFTFYPYFNYPSSTDTVSIIRPYISLAYTTETIWFQRGHTITVPVVSTPSSFNNPISYSSLTGGAPVLIVTDTSDTNNNYSATLNSLSSTSATIQTIGSDLYCMPAYSIIQAVAPTTQSNYPGLLGFVISCESGVCTASNLITSLYNGLTVMVDNNGSSVTGLIAGLTISTTGITTFSLLINGAKQSITINSQSMNPIWLVDNTPGTYVDITSSQLFVYAGYVVKQNSDYTLTTGGPLSNTLSTIPVYAFSGSTTYSGSVSNPFTLNYFLLSGSNTSYSVTAQLNMSYINPNYTFAGGSGAYEGPIPQYTPIYAVSVCGIDSAVGGFVTALNNYTTVIC